MSKGLPIRKILLGVLLVVVGVQVGVYFALTEKKKKEEADPLASAAGMTDAAAAAATPADAGTRVMEPDPATDAGTEATAAIEDPAADPAVDPATPDPRPAVSAAPAGETAAERRRRERREQREAERQKRLEEEREKRIEERRRAAIEEQRRDEERRQKAEAERKARAEAKTRGTATFLVKPDGANLAVDGVFVGTSPMREVDTAVGTHTLAASAPGYVAKSVKFSVRSQRNRTVRITLKRVEEKPAVVADAKPKRPATPRVSGLGSASRGRGLVSSKCNACHRARGARSIGPRSRRRGSWDRFFSRGYHDRYERIGGLVSRSAMADIKAYLMENAKCDSNAAGEKCK